MDHAVEVAEVLIPCLARATSANCIAGPRTLTRSVDSTGPGWLLRVTKSTVSPGGKQQQEPGGSFGGSGHRPGWEFAIEFPAEWALTMLRLRYERSWPSNPQS